MELSPLAKERLAKIGELTEEEKARIRYARELSELLAKYFTSELNAEGLWKALQEHRNAGREFILRDAQRRLLETVSLSGSDTDFDKVRRGILAVETLKEDGDYSGIEHDLKSLEDLRRQYQGEKEEVYEAIKANVEKQVRLAAQQLAGQAAAKGIAIDFQGSVEASVKATPEWKTFVARHEDTYNQKLKERIAALRQKLNI